MSVLAPTLTKKEFQNWVKGALALLFTKDGLADFVSAEVNRHHQRLLQRVPTANMSNTCNCTINSLPQCTRSRNHGHIVPGPSQLCSRGVCNILMDGICKDHRYIGPSWKNTNPQQWCTDAFEVAKCYMAPDGYSHHTSLSETDFNGILAVIINNLSFATQIQDNLASEPNICTKARKVGREIRHTPDHLLSDGDLRDYIDHLINLLCDPACLLNDPSAQDAVRKLRSLKANDLTIHEKDLTEVLRENPKDTFSQEHRVLLQKITDHYSKLQTDSVAEIDKIVAAKKTELEEHANKLTNKITDDITRHAELKIQEIEKYDEIKDKKDFEEKVKDLKEDLIAYYRDNESQIPADPLVEEHKVALEDLYVIPPMWAYDNPYQFGPGNESHQKSDSDTSKRHKVTVSKLYLSDQNVRCKKIFITANAGFGKTSLSQKLTMIWCQTQTPLETEQFKKAVLDTKEAELYSEEAEIDSEEAELDSEVAEKDFEEAELDSDEAEIDSEEAELDSEEAEKDSEEAELDSEEAEKYFEEAELDSKEAETDSEEANLDYEEAELDSEEAELDSEESELESLRYFDLLFLLHLRDYQCESKCNLDDLIINMVANKLSRSRQYTKVFLQRCLHDKRCLIILDGLDEWSHPGHCSRKPEVPHNNHPDSCTVLTTTRDWKLGTIGLSPKDIDRRVEIAMLDDERRKQVEENAIYILNEKKINLVGKYIEDFDKEIESVEIGDIIYIPYILLQLMCLFFGGLPIGKSKCEIYSNITEFTLKRGLNRKNLSGLNLQSNENAVVPICMNENKTCKLYISLIMKLGKLASFTLFGEKKESSLIIDSKVVILYMTEQEIDFCLNVGLLCQTRDNSILAERRYKVFFQHKSVQEFFSAIYITSEWETNTVKLLFTKSFSSLESTLELFNLFVFVCGMNHEIYTCISGEIQKIVDLHVIRRRYRSDVYTIYDSSICNDDWRTIKSYQSMQVQCFQECLRNRNKSCSIQLYDIVLDDSLTEDEFTALQTVIHLFNGNVKSLNIRFPDEKMGDFVASLYSNEFTSMETLKVEFCDKEPVWLANMLTKYACTLNCLTLIGHYYEKRMFLSDINITALTGQASLKSLYLLYVIMDHSNLKRLYGYISQTTTLTQLKLVQIVCCDHMDQNHRDCDVTLDLHRLNELKMFYLTMVPCRKLHVKSICLEKLEFVPWRNIIDSANASLLQDLRTAPVLTELGLGRMSLCQMIQINHTLSQLQHQLKFLKLGWIGMGDLIPHITPAMTQLEHVELSAVKLSSAAWRKLFFSVGQLQQSLTVKITFIKMTSQEWMELLLSICGIPQAVTVKIDRCKGPSRDEWMIIVEGITSTPTLSLLQQLSIDNRHRASLTLKKQ